MKWQTRTLRYYWPAWQFNGRVEIHRLLPTPGNVIFTLLVLGGLFWAQSVGAITLGASTTGSPSTGTIAYQGRLADTGGAPLTGTYNMIFRLYPAATGGVPLWQEQWTGSNSVQVSDGLFNVMLGSLTPVPQEVIVSNGSLFLGITVGTDSEMSPRVQLGSVPFATQALTVPDGSITKAKLAADISLDPPDGSITAAKLADGAVTSAKVDPNGLQLNGIVNAKFEGFSYYTGGYSKTAGWNPIIVSTLDFNTFGTSSYDTTSGTFTAPKVGYYRFHTYGYIATGGTANERIAIGILKNGGSVAFSGGQFSAVDTPGPYFSHALYLQVGDKIRVTSYTPIDATFGGGGGAWWFQGEYLGR